MTRPRNKPALKTTARPSAEKKFAAKATSAIFILLLLVIPFYLYATRSKTSIELVLVSPLVNLQLKYNETDKLLDREVRMLDNSLDTKYLSCSHFKPVTLSTKSTVGTNVSEYQIVPLVKEKANLMMTTDYGFFSLISLAYKGSTQAEISASDSFFTFAFRNAPEAREAWQVYADISLPDKFQCKPEDCTVNLLTPGRPPSTIADLAMTPLFSTNLSPNMVLANSGGQMRLKIENDFLTNKILFNNLNLSSFHTLRFDPNQRRSVSVLKDGYYQFFDHSDTDKHKIAKNSMIEFVADSLMLVELELRDRLLAAKILGKFSSFKICNLGSCDEMIPPYFKSLKESKLAIFIYIIILITFIEILIDRGGDRKRSKFKPVIDFVKRVIDFVKKFLGS